MSNGNAPKLSSCGCCQGEPDLTTISNRPGLSTLSYRIGTYGLFFERLLDQIHSFAIPDGANKGSHPLANLTTRSQDDPAIALLDAWAVIADVLTFYQERIANEGFLRTAIERRSILELAREIGYELSPGVAASAYLQFTVEEIIGTAPPPSVNIPGIKTQPPSGPGSAAFNSGIVGIPQGTQVQSIPGPGQVPQTFETSADFQAHVEWNTLRPRQSRQQDLVLVRKTVGGVDTYQLYLLGTTSSFPADAPVEQLAVPDIYLLNPLTQLDFMSPKFVPPPFNPGLVLGGLNLGLFQATAFQPLLLNQAQRQPFALQRKQVQNKTLAFGKGPAIEVTGLGVNEATGFARAPGGDQTGAQQDDRKIPGVPVNFVYLQGTSTNINSGDRLLFVGMQVDVTQTAAFVVRSVIPDNSNNRTLVEFGDTVAIPEFTPGSFAATDLKVQNQPFNQDNVTQYILSKTVTEGDLQAFLKMNNWNAADLETLVNNPPPPPSSERGVHSFGATAKFFGHNAPLHATLPSTSNTRAATGGDPDPYGKNWDTANSNAGPYIWTNSQSAPYTDANAFLERSFSQILKTSGDNTQPQSWAWLECQVATPPALPLSKAYRVTAVVEKSLADYGLSGKSTGLAFDPAPNQTNPDSSDQFLVRKTTAWVQSQQLALATVPVIDDILPGTTQLMLDNMVIGLTPGQPVALSGIQSDPPGVTANEILILQSITHIAGFTVLGFTTGIKNRYSRSSVTISANVALATHGATVQEVLGSGDGSKTNQSFTLKRPPLTYVSAPTPSGIASTLQIRVNGIEWQEAPSFYGLTSSDKDYVVRLADDGTPTITFGDPADRLRTGQQNVTATYRTGIGLAGNVDAGTLTLLQSRPPGLRGVTNPLPAGGAADPQNLSDARSNAPLTVLTLDRIVSLDDYQSFTQAFAGIGKAQAVAVWSGETHVIQITVAAANGATIGPTDPLMQTLVQAINLAHDPVQNFVVAGFQLLTFNLNAGILIDTPTFLVSDVMANALSALTTAFSFANRSFAQAVTAAEILKLLQAVPGVIAVDLNQLYLTSDNTGPSQTEPPPFLNALPAHFDSGAIQPAQLLLLNPLGVTLTEITS